MKHCTLVIVGLIVPALSNAASFTMSSKDDCQKLAAYIKSDDVSRFSVSLPDLSARYSLIKKFSAGKGGAYVALVKDTASGEEKVLKIFPTIEKDSNKYNYRELYYTCLNSFITYNDVGMKLDPMPANQNVFPRIFEIGITNSPDFSSKTASHNFPYMVFEFVHGQSLTALAEEAAAGTGGTGYRLYKKGERSFSAAIKRASEGVAYQIVHLLYKLKHMKVLGREYGFYHADLNAGNVMVQNKSATITFDAGFGAKKLTNVPLVTFIDFGHSTSNFDDNLGSKVNSLKTTYHKAIHIFSGSTGDFYKNLNGESLSKASELKIGITSTNSDMRLFRLMTRALYDSGNFVNDALMKHLKDCKTTTECVSNAGPLW